MRTTRRRRSWRTPRSSTEVRLRAQARHPWRPRQLSPAADSACQFGQAGRGANFDSGEAVRCTARPAKTGIMGKLTSMLPSTKK